MFNRIIRKTVIFICTLAILFSNTLTVYAYDYKEQGVNEYEINENTPLSEDEIDKILEDNDSSLFENETGEISEEDDDSEISEDEILADEGIQEDTNINDNIEETDDLANYNGQSLSNMSFGAAPQTDPNNTINISPSLPDGFIVAGAIEDSFNDYSFDHIDIYKAGEDSPVESINSLDNNTFSSSLINNYNLDEKYQYSITVYYTKELVDDLGSPIIDEETSLPKTDTINYSYNTDEFSITKLNKEYSPLKLSKAYSISYNSLINDNNISSNTISKDTLLFLRNPKEKYEPISLLESDLEILSNIGFIDDNTYIDDTNIATGNFIYYNNDLFIDEYNGISIDRYYNSFNNLNDNYFSNFTSSLDVKLIPISDYYVLILEDGRIIKLTSNGSLYKSLDNRYELSNDSNIYTVKDLYNDQDTYSFNEYLELESYSNKYGLIYSLIYDDHKLSKLITKANKELTFELDSHSHITKINLPNGSSITYEYSNDLLVSVTDQSDYKLTYEYDNNLLSNVLDNNNNSLKTITYDDKKVISIKYGEANSSLFTYDFDNKTTTYLNPNNYTYKYEYNDLNEVTRLTFPDDAYEDYSYDSNRNLKFFTSRPISNNIRQATTYDYDSRSNITRIAKPSGVSVSYTYDLFNNVTSYTDEGGDKTTYEYNSNNILVKTTYSDGTNTINTYDDNNRLLTSTDEKGNTTSYEYSEYLDKTIKEIDPQGNTKEYTYDSLGNNITITIDSKTTTLEYDNKSNLIKSTSSDNKSSSITYDQFNNITSKTDEIGNITSFEYDLNGNLIKEIMPSGTITYTYDSLGNMISKTDPLGNTYRYEYDFDNNLVKTIDPDNISSGSKYDSKGNILSTTDKRGFTEYFEYHPTLNGKVTKHIDKLGRVYLYEYDDKGNKLSETLPDSTKLEYTYDSKNRVLTSTTEQGIKITYTYDNAGNITKKENSLGNYEEYTYDSNNNLLSEKDALGNIATYTYDSAKRLSTKTLPNGLKTTYSYDEVGNLIQENTNGHITKYTYSGNNLTSKTDPNGNKVTYTYDGSNRPTKETYKDGSINSVVYDSNGNVTQRIDPYGHITKYEFDSNKNNTKVIDPKGNITLYEYDAEGNNTKITYPNGKSITYEYNALSWLTKITESTGLITDITYDTMGKITSTISNNGIEEYSNYDQYGNLIETKDQVGNTTTFTYNQRGLLLSSSSYTGETHEYTYDALERLVASKDSKGIITTYEYDSNSNLVKTSDSLGHEIVNTLDLFGNAIESKDSLGIITKYEYDSNNNISKIIYDDNTSESFSYDYLNRQVSHTGPNGNTSTCKYDLNGNLLEEVSPLGIKTIYEYDELNNLKAKKEGSYTTTYEYDSMSNNIKIIDPYGAETFFTYDLDGNLISTKNPYNSITSYEYDNRNNLIKTAYDNGIFEENEYDNLNRITSKKDVYGLITSYEYDSKNNLIKIYNDLGQEELLEYDGYNRVIKDTINGKGETTYTYDLNDNILSKEVNGLKTEYDYDLNNNLLNTYYPNSRIVTNIYNLKNQVIEVHDGTIEDYRIYKYEYDPNGNLIKYTNPLEKTISYTYDSNNRKLTESDYLGNTSSYTYDNFNNPITITDFNGNTTTYEYDYYSKPTKIIDPLGNETINEYDLMSSLIKTIDPTGRVSMYEYDKRGNLSKQIYNSATSPLDIEDQREVIYTYDKYSNLLYINNGKNSEENEYDEYGRLSKITYPNGSITTNEYDYNSNLIKTTSKAKNNTETTLYSYDEQGRIKESSNNFTKTTYSYNEYNQLEEVNESGSIISYEYDIYGNVSKLTYPDKSTVEYSYDSLDNIINLTDKMGDSTLEYDANNRLINQLTTTNRSVYTYDNNGNKISAINTDLNDNLISSYFYEYDSLNKTTKEVITDPNGTTTKEYYYNESNDISKLIETDNKGDITTFEYEFDIYGNKVKELVTDPKGQLTTSSYLYNNDNQLIEKLIDSKNTETYKYDDNGNLIYKNTPNGTYNYTYSPSNKLEETYLNGNLETRYFYNSNNLKSHELIRKEYPYDYDVDDSYYSNLRKFIVELEDKHIPYFDSNKQELTDSQDKQAPKSIFRIIADFFIDLGTTVWNFFVDAYYFITGKHRVKLNLNDNFVKNEFEYETSDINFLFPSIKPTFFKRLNDLFHTEDDIQVIFESGKYSYDYSYSNPLILSEGYNSTSIKSNYVYVGDRLLEDTKKNNSYLYDGKYSISEVKGNKDLTLRYDIYGNITNTKLTQEDKTFGYNTLEYTPQNNLTYIRARYYDSSTGTFISKDTYLGNIYKPNTTNRYAYCSGDPVNYIDLDGHRKFAYDDTHTTRLGYEPPSKPKTSSVDSKTSNNVVPYGAYIDGGFDGGSSYVYVPPPPDPRQYYRPLVVGPYVYSTNNHDYISSQLNKNKTIKELSAGNDGGYGAGNYSMLYASTANNLSKCEKETVTNNYYLFGYYNQVKIIDKGNISLNYVNDYAQTYIGVEKGVIVSNTKENTNNVLSFFTTESVINGSTLEHSGGIKLDLFGLNGSIAINSDFDLLSGSLGYKEYVNIEAEVGKRIDISFDVDNKIYSAGIEDNKAYYLNGKNNGSISEYVKHYCQNDIFSYVPVVVDTFLLYYLDKSIGMLSSFGNLVME